MPKHNFGVFVSEDNTVHFFIVGTVSLRGIHQGLCGATAPNPNSLRPALMCDYCMAGAVEMWTTEE